MRQSLQEAHLKRIPDLFRLSAKFQRRTASLQVSGSPSACTDVSHRSQDVVRAYQVCLGLAGLVQTLVSWSGKHAKLIADEFVEPFRVRRLRAIFLSVAHG